MFARREERIEDRTPRLGGDPGAAVCDDDLHAICVVAAGEAERASVRHCIASVGYDVREHLAELPQADSDVGYIAIAQTGWMR